MKLFTVLTLFVAVALCTVTCSPIKKDGRGVLINRPTKEEIFNSKIRRSETAHSKMRRRVFDPKLMRSEAVFDTKIRESDVFKNRIKRSETFSSKARRDGEYNLRIRGSETLRFKMKRGVLDTRLIKSGKVYDTGFAAEEKHIRGVQGKSETFDSLDLNVRKGEYKCGNRVCSLKPGEVPQHCKDCQYRVYMGL